MTQNLPFPQITSTAGLAGLLHFKKKTKKNNSLIWFFSLFSLLTSIVWDRQSELGLFLGGWVELHAGRWEGGAGCCFRRNCGARGAVDVCSQLPSYKTHIRTQHASSFFESLSLSLSLSRSLSLSLYVCMCLCFSVHSPYEWIKQYVWGHMYDFTDMCGFGCAWVWAMIALQLTSESNHWLLMKGCCHLFCRSATIRAPCGSSDRLFFCITLDLRVQCINLTLLGETKEGPLLQYNNSARMETWLISATATCRSIFTPAQHCCQHRKCMWTVVSVNNTWHFYFLPGGQENQSHRWGILTRWLAFSLDEQNCFDMKLTRKSSETSTVS